MYHPSIIMLLIMQYNSEYFIAKSLATLRLRFFQTYLSEENKLQNYFTSFLGFTDRYGGKNKPLSP